MTSPTSSVFLLTRIWVCGRLNPMERQSQHAKREIDVTGLPEEAVQAVESVVSLLRRRPARGPKVSPDELLGLFRDEPELLDEIVEDAMKTRETLPLRVPRE